MMKLGAFAAASLFILVTVFRESSSQLTDTCLLNRLEFTECTFRFPDTTNMPMESELGLYSTRIRGPNIDELSCAIRRRNHQVRPIQTFDGDSRLMYLYSPGKELEDPQDYGNQMIVFYNVSCPDDSRAFLNITRIDMEEPNCDDGTELRCVDYVRVLHGGEDGGFGFTESCGNDPEMNREIVTSDSFLIIFRTSDSTRLPGFEATVTCVASEDTSDDNRRRKRFTREAAQFEADLQRQIDYITRISRYYQYLGYYRQYLLWYPWLFRLETVIIQFGQNFTYRNNRLTTQQGIDSQSFKEITILKVLNADEEVSVFRRSATDKFWKPILFSGPGTLIIVGCSAFYRNFIVSQRGILPLTDEERSLVNTLTTFYIDSNVLEAPEQRLCDEIVDPPSFNFTSFPIEDLDDNDTSIAECPRPSVNISGICNYTDENLRLALANEDAENLLVRTVVDVVLECTRRQQPGRLENLTDEFEASCSIRKAGDKFLVSCSSNRDGGVSFTSCRVVDGSGRSVRIDSFCEYPSFTFPVLETMIRPGEQTLILDLEDSEGSITTEEVAFSVPLLVNCSTRFGFGRFSVNVTCSSNQNSLTVTRCVLDGTTTLTQCVFPNFVISTAELRQGRHNVELTFLDEAFGSVSLTLTFTLLG